MENIKENLLTKETKLPIFAFLKGMLFNKMGDGNQMGSVVHKENNNGYSDRLYTKSGDYFLVNQLKSFSRFEYKEIIMNEKDITKVFVYGEHHAAKGSKYSYLDIEQFNSALVDIDAHFYCADDSEFNMLNAIEQWIKSGRKMLIVEKLR